MLTPGAKPFLSRTIQRGCGVGRSGANGTCGALVSIAICVRLWGSKMNS